MSILRLLVPMIFVFTSMFSMTCSSSVRYLPNKRSHAVNIRASENQRIARGKKSAVISGYASYYGPGFHGKLTANGETFDMNSMTAAHKTLPFNTRVKVTNIENGKSVVVRINDRGPFVKGRIIDLSVEAAKRLDMMDSGIARVTLEVKK